MAARECLLLLTADTAAPATAGNGTAGPVPDGVCVVHWRGWEVPAGHVSLEARLREDLPAIRQEHAAWAFEMGCQPFRGRPLQQWLQGGAPLSMWWCSLLYERHPKMTPGLFTVYKLRALERLMDVEGCAVLRVRGGDARLRRCLAQLCRSRHRDFREEDAPSASGQAPRGLLRRCYDAAPAPLRALARFLHWWWTVRRHLPPAKDGLPKAHRQTATIVTYFPNIDMEAARQGRFRSRYWETLHDALNQAAEKAGGPFVRWLFIRFPAPDLSFRQCRELRDRFRATAKDGASFHYLEECLRFRDLAAAFWRYLRLALTSLRLEAAVRPAFHFAASRLNFWTWLGPYWTESFRGWRCLERCLQYRAFERYATLAGPQRWTLFPLENCPWERMCAQTVHAAGNGPVIGAQHSVIRPTDFRYFDDPRSFADDMGQAQPDAIRGNGLAAIRQWRAAGLPEDRLGEVEALRYLYLRPSLDGAPPCGPAASARHLLVVTSFFADETDAHLALLARVVAAGLLDGWKVRVKPHPYLPVESRLQALLGRRAAEIAIADGPIASHLTPGTLVWASNSTTVTLEAALKGLPVMAMWPQDDFDLCPLQDVASLPRTGSLEDVARILAHPEAMRLPPRYFDLDGALPRWRALLGLD